MLRGNEAPQCIDKLDTQNGLDEHCRSRWLVVIGALVAHHERELQPDKASHDMPPPLDGRADVENGRRQSFAIDATKGLAGTRSRVHLRTGAFQKHPQAVGRERLLGDDEDRTSGKRLDRHDGSSARASCA
jgi:hypothetical protein